MICIIDTIKPGENQVLLVLRNIQKEKGKDYNESYVTSWLLRQHRQVMKWKN